jgi:hypothetical protein
MCNFCVVDPVIILVVAALVAPMAINIIVR